MERWVDVAGVADLDECLAVQVGELEIGLFRSKSGIHAVSNSCTHVGAPLTDGYITGDDVLCPWHGAKFCLKTGASHGPPAMSGLRVFVTKISGDRILVQVNS
ncbi:MAG: Rieske 2Fe-2S domain-containing protein [Acidobacteria bacterium]|nr:Rieske 2Fe-2S domain-containing protein [Acidobacteriota bacterium]